jgi:hypothetical protein
MSIAARVRHPPSPPFIDPPGYCRHRPERTLLYQLVEQHYPAFRELRALSCRETGGVQLQEARVLSLLRRPAYGRDRGAVGR